MTSKFTINQKVVSSEFGECEVVNVYTSAVEGPPVYRIEDDSKTEWLVEEDDLNESEDEQ